MLENVFLLRTQALTALSSFNLGHIAMQLLIVTEEASPQEAHIKFEV